MNILLITGETGIGKDTLAENLKNSDLLNFCPHLYAFGDALKQVTSELYWMNKNDLYGNKNLDSQFVTELSDGAISTNRQLIQTTADTIKKYNQLFFTNITLENVERVPFVIFTDWRFPYELTAIWQRFPDAKIRGVRLKQETGKTKNKTHNSDTSLNAHVVDFELDNTRLSPEQTCEIVAKRVLMWFPSLSGK